MTIPLDTGRCQGRQVRSMGQSTLARQCIDCERRTDIPVGVDLWWIQPPPIVFQWAGCPQYLSPDEMEVTGI